MNNEDIYSKEEIRCMIEKGIISREGINRFGNGQFNLSLLILSLAYHTATGD